MSKFLEFYHVTHRVKLRTPFGQETTVHEETLYCVRASQLQDLDIDYDRSDVDCDGDILLSAEEFSFEEYIHTYTNDGWCISLIRVA